MLYLILGIVIGAGFHEFWHSLFRRCQAKVNQWISQYQQKGESEVMEGEVVEPDTNNKPASAS